MHNLAEILKFPAFFFFVPELFPIFATKEIINIQVKPLKKRFANEVENRRKR